MGVRIVALLAVLLLLIAAPAAALLWKFLRLTSAPIRPVVEKIAA